MSLPDDYHNPAEDVVRTRWWGWTTVAYGQLLYGGAVSRGTVLWSNL